MPVLELTAAHCILPRVKTPLLTALKKSGDCAQHPCAPEWHAFTNEVYKPLVLLYKPLSLAHHTSSMHSDMTMHKVQRLQTTDTGQHLCSRHSVPSNSVPSCPKVFFSGKFNPMSVKLGFIGNQSTQKRCTRPWLHPCISFAARPLLLAAFSDSP